MDEQALVRAAELLAHDLTATLGWQAGQARMEARAALDNRASLLLTGTWDDLDLATRRQVLDDAEIAPLGMLQGMANPPGRHP